MALKTIIIFKKKIKILVQIHCYIKINCIFVV